LFDPVIGLHHLQALNKTVNGVLESNTNLGIDACP
jgi:hypothetical protein